MAEWTSIPSTVFETDQPILGSTHQAIVTNFSALAEGALGAPRNFMESFERLSPGSTIKRRNDATTDTGGTSQRVRLDIALQFGTIRCTGEIRRLQSIFGGEAAMRVTRQRQGSETTIAEETTTSTSFQQQEIDVPVIPGDILRIYLVQLEPGATGDVQGRNFRFQTADNDIFPVEIGPPIEGNRTNAP